MVYTVRNVVCSLIAHREPEVARSCKDRVPAARTPACRGALSVWMAASRNVKTARETIEGIHVRYCQPLQRGDGYTYTKGAALPPQA